MNTHFYFMHKNDIVALISCNQNTGQIEDVDKIVVDELLPFGTRQSDVALQKWWSMRAIPKTRKGVAAALQILDLPETECLLLQNLGLSLTDHYWIRPVESNLTWEKVNLYENDFSDILGELSLTGNEELVTDIKGKTMFLPSASLQGELAKKWIIGSDNKRYLVKGNYGISCQQSLNEVLATKIHKTQGIFPYTPYCLTKLSTTFGDNLGCYCPNFANKDLEFIPAIDIANSEKKTNDVSEFEFFIKMCEKNGLSTEYVSSFLQYQIEADFVMTNTDRHFNNFGVLRDTNTLQFVSMAPIYDTGNSMFWNMTKVPENFKYLDISVSSFRKKEHQMLEYVTEKRIFDISKLPEDGEIRSLFENDELMIPKRLDSIMDAYHKKVELLELFQRGADMGRLSFQSRKIPINDIIMNEKELLCTQESDLEKE